MKLCCTSVMLPRWTLDETFDKLAECGYDAVELRCRYNPDEDSAPAFWGRHLSDVSPDNIVDKAPAIRAAAARSGVRVAALAPKCLIDEEDEIRKLCAGAVALDANQPPLIRIGAPAHDRTKPYMPQFQAARAGFAQVAEIAGDYGVKVLYEIHTGTVAVTCSRAWELLRDLDPARIGAIYDVPNMLRVGLEDTRLGMEVLGPYMAHVHIGNGVLEKKERDGHGQQKWQWAFCALQEGVADIPQIVQDLRDVGYGGYVSLEEFGPGDDGEKIAAQGAYLRALAAA